MVLNRSSGSYIHFILFFLHLLNTPCRGGGYGGTGEYVYACIGAMEDREEGGGGRERMGREGGREERKEGGKGREDCITGVLRYFA